MNGNELKVYESSMFEAITALKIRALNVDDNPWFIARDVCACLELENVNMALQSLDNDEKATPLKLDCSRKVKGLRKDTLLISEPGLYRLLFRSNKPEARRFQDWVCGEVLPSIRRTGGYMLAHPEESPETLMARAVKVAEEALRRSRQSVTNVIDVPFKTLT